MGLPASRAHSNRAVHEWRSVPSVDSDTCRWAATAANSRFSGGVGRAVIDGAVAFEAPLFTARQSVLLQIADTSLSCHHSNNDPTPDFDPTPTCSHRSTNTNLHIARTTELLGEGYRCFFSETRPGRHDDRVSSIEYNARSIT